MGFFLEELIVKESIEEGGTTPWKLSRIFLYIKGKKPFQAAGTANRVAVN